MTNPKLTWTTHVETLVNVVRHGNADGKKRALEELRQMANTADCAAELLESMTFIDKELSQHPDHSGSKNPVFYALNRAREAIAKYTG